MALMMCSKISLLTIGVITLVMLMLEIQAHPDHQHIHHKIHVPTKVVYRTKIIKVPEHHHHHHYKVKEKEKIKFVDIHPIHEPSDDGFQDFGNEELGYADESRQHQSVYKSPQNSLKKRRKSSS